MYLPFCGIAISNAQLFAASRKEYDRSRVGAKCTSRDKRSCVPLDQLYFVLSDADVGADYWSAAAHLLRLQKGLTEGSYRGGWGHFFVFVFYIKWSKFFCEYEIY